MNFWHQMPREGEKLHAQSHHFRWDGPVMVRLTGTLLKSSMGFQDAKEEKHTEPTGTRSALADAEMLHFSSSYDVCI